MITCISTSTRRRVVAVLAVTMVAGLGACGGGQDEADGIDPAAATVAPPGPLGLGTSTTAATSTTPSAPPPSTTASAASTPPASAADHGPELFVMPSRNIGCAFQPARDGEEASVRCDILSHTYQPTPKPASCEFEWGQALYVERVTAGFLCISDTVFDPNAPVLAHGSSMKRGELDCRSAETGVTCRHLGSGRGFRLARASYDIF